MDIVVKGRHCAVSDRFKRHVADKLAKLERLDRKVMRIDVEVSKEHNPRQAYQSERIELTVLSKGPVIRAEAAADDRYAALDAAVDKLVMRLRKAADRRRVHHGTRAPISVARATAATTNGAGPATEEETPPSPADLERPAASPTGSPTVSPTVSPTASPTVSPTGPIEVDGEGPLVVREKTHAASPMSLAQALYEMELVGHDFYLFVDADSRMPSVVYRRRGYDYGVIRLAV